jgi:hypothetical protein
MRKIIIILSLFCSTALGAQSLSPTATLSLLTCGPGAELYAAFGHSAVRVCDTARKLDLVFNYGTFDFEAPGFYMNFVRGKLNYMLHVTTFDHFMMGYMLDERWVEEQVFDLTPEEKQQVFAFLVNNSLPENRTYLYDFLFDNCTSRIRDLLAGLFPNQVAFPDEALEPAPTFRQMIYMYLPRMPWSKLGIDLLLGRRVDRVATPYEYLFLPDYLSAATEHTLIDHRPLTGAGHRLYDNETPAGKRILFEPWLIFALLLVVVVVAHLLRVPLRGFDAGFFFVVGLLGVLLVFMWAGTNHYVTKENFNLLWAVPAHAVAAVFLLRKQRPGWVAWYFAANTLLCLLLLACWPVLPQHLNTALLPVVALLGFRSCVVAWPRLRRLFTSFHTSKKIISDAHHS